MAEMFFRGSAGWIPALDVGKDGEDSVAGLELNIWMSCILVRGERFTENQI